MPGNFIWQIQGKDKALYLTFDDGPVTGITEKALTILEHFNAKATFFCVGDNVRKNPETFQKILETGHAVGNHTFHHLNGWKTSAEDYIRDTELCAKVVDSKLFRPPYGRIKRRQAKILSADYKIIMWSVLSGDFDPLVSVKQCVNNVLRNASAGSIIVMHDQQKSASTMLKALPVILKYYSEKGFRFLAM